MYTGYARLYLSLAACRHYCTDPDVTWGLVRNLGVSSIVVHYWADLQSVHGFRCYDNIAPNEMSASACIFALCLVKALTPRRCYNMRHFS